MSASFTTNPNVMFDLFFCERTQIKIDTRIFPSRLYSDRGSFCGAFHKTHFIEASRQYGCVMTVDIRAADNRRGLFAFLLKSDFGVLKRTAIGAYDISLDRGSLRRERRRKSKRTCEKKSDNKTLPAHQLTLRQS